MRAYFPHFVDAEYAEVLGAKRAARLVDRHLKFLALLGARISVGASVLVDSPGLQPVVANQEFREFITDYDQGFMRLEAPGHTSLSHGGPDWVARDAWRRMQLPGWVSSSKIGTPAMVAAAAEALAVDFGSSTDRTRFQAQVRRIAEQFSLDDDGSSILVGTFDMLDWFATSGLAKTTAKKKESPTYYEKLLEALEVPGLPGVEYAALSRTVEFIDDCAENKRERSAVLAALARDIAMDRSKKDEIRACVSSAWMAAMSEGSNASVSLTLPLPSGVLIPRVLGRPTEAFVNIEQVGDLVRRNPLLRIEDSLTVNLSRLSWREVADLIERTRTTRSLVTGALDSEQDVDRHLIAAHLRSLKRNLQKTFPKLTKAEAFRFTVSVVSASVAQGTPFRFAGAAVAGTEVMRSMYRWTRGRFIAGTLNRFVGRVSTREDSDLSDALLP